MRPTAFRVRMERLEASQADTETPRLLLSSCPLSDEPPTAGEIERWLAEGVAHVAFNGRVIFYDDGEKEPLTEEQWRFRYFTPA